MPLTATEIGTILRLVESQNKAEERSKKAKDKLEDQMLYYKNMLIVIQQKYEQITSEQLAKFERAEIEIKGILQHRAITDQYKYEISLDEAKRRVYEQVNLGHLLENGGQVSESEPSNQPEGETEPDVAE